MSVPIAHRRVIRTTNLLEPLFGEERRRTKVNPHAFGERAVLKPMYAALSRASQGLAPRRDQELRTQLDEFKERTASTVSPASRERIYSRDRT